MFLFIYEKYILGEIHLICLYDLLNAAPDLLAQSQICLLDALTMSLRDVQESLRTQSAQLIGILWAYGSESDQEFNHYIEECLKSLSQRSIEQKHGWLLVIGHALSKRLDFYKSQDIEKNILEWKEFIESIKIMGKFNNFVIFLSFVISINL